MAFETSILIEIDSRPAQKGARDFRGATESIVRDADRTTAAINKSIGAFKRLRLVLSNLGSGDIGLMSLGRQIAAFDQRLGGLQQRLSSFGRAGGLGFGEMALQIDNLNNKAALFEQKFASQVSSNRGSQTTLGAVSKISTAIKGAGGAFLDLASAAEVAGRTTKTLARSTPALVGRLGSLVRVLRGVGFGLRFFGGIGLAASLAIEPVAFLIGKIAQSKSVLIGFGKETQIILKELEGVDKRNKLLTNAQVVNLESARTGIESMIQRRVNELQGADKQIKNIQERNKNFVGKPGRPDLRPESTRELERTRRGIAGTITSLQGELGVINAELEKVAGKAGTVEKNIAVNLARELDKNLTRALGDAKRRLDAARIGVEKLREVELDIQSRNLVTKATKGIAKLDTPEGRKAVGRAKLAIIKSQQADKAGAQLRTANQRNKAIQDEINQTKILIEARFKGGDATKQARIQLEIMNEASRQKTTVDELEKNGTAQNIRDLVKFRDELEKLNAAQRKAQELAAAFQRPFDEAAEAIASTFEDTFATILRTGEFSFKDLAGSIKGIFINLASEVARLLIFQPVVAGVFGGLGLNGSLLSGGGGVTSIVAGGASSGGGVSASQGASLLGSGNTIFGDPFGVRGLFSNVGASVNSFGAGLGIGLGNGVVGGFDSAGFISAGGQFNSARQLVSVPGSTLTSILGAAGLGATLGGFVGPLVGLNGTGSTIGGGLGAGLGAALATSGSLVLPVVGGIVGTVLGGLLGGLFGGQPSVGPNSAARIRGNPLRIESLGADNGGNLDAARQLGAAAILALNRTAEALGATINPKPKTLAVGFDPSGARAGIRVSGGQFDFFSKGKEPDEVIRDLVLHQLKLPDFFRGISDAASMAIANSAATSLDDLLSDLDFATGVQNAAEGLFVAADELDRINIAARQASEAQLPAILEFLGRAKGLGLTDQAGQALDKAIDNLIDFTENDQAITESEKALAALEGRFEGLKTVLEKLGRPISLADAALASATAKLTEGFNEAIRSQILAITDPVAAALEGFDKLAESRLREARAIGAEIVDVERLNALERVRAIDRATNQATDSFKRLFDELSFGMLGGAAPAAALAGSRAALEAANVQANAGDFAARGRLPGLVRQFVDASRTFNASGAGFAEDRVRALDIVSQFLPGFQHGGAFTVSGFGGADSQFVAFRATPGERVNVGAGDGNVVEAINENTRQVARQTSIVDARLATIARRVADLEEENRRLRRDMRLSTEGMKKAS